MQSTSSASLITPSVFVLLLTSLSPAFAALPPELHGERVDLVIKGYVWLESDWQPSGSAEDLEASMQRLGATHYAWGTHSVREYAVEKSLGVDTRPGSSNFGDITIVPGGGVFGDEYSLVAKRHIDFYRFAPEEAMTEAFRWAIMERVDPNIVRGWLASGLSPNATDKDGNTMLHWLADAASIPDRSEYLTREEVESGFDSLSSPRGDRMEQIARLLIDAGADAALRGGGDSNSNPIERFRSLAASGTLWVPRFTAQRILEWLAPDGPSESGQFLVLNPDTDEIVIDLDEASSPQHAAALRLMAESGELDGLFFTYDYQRGFTSTDGSKIDGSIIDLSVLTEGENPLDLEARPGAVVAVQRDGQQQQGRANPTYEFLIITDVRGSSMYNLDLVNTPGTRVGTVVQNLDRAARSGIVESARMASLDEIAQ